ncbi:DUF7822 domain-containing protein [Achromobacter xylosoxidans]|uniref:DUF7822 domain-containing protein n=1 Tax=Alcaligenes xylosoxydans xylosoxydans TaxID=85698 RepID=UPI0021C0CEBF|nr:hypothetical protein [Achromobacter xylosoxidans]UXL02847.1 hypothetical protein N4T34_18405 [Achromobacter xylosoxidans]
MANRSYLYSLSNRPASYADRPETICGLSEWPYAVPFSYRLLMSGDPQLCASLIADGLEDDEPHRRTRLYAISSRFEPGLARIKRFAEIVRAAVGGAAPATATTPAAEPAPSLLGRIRRLFSSADAAPARPATTAPTELLAALDETIAFLEAHRDDYLLLETIELDVMAESEEAALKASVEKELARCRQAGAALDALPADPAEAGRQLLAATRERGAAPLDALHGLRLDDSFDGGRNQRVDYILGLMWSEVLYFDLLDRAEFEARQREAQAE